MKTKLLLMTFAISIAMVLQLKAQLPSWAMSNTAFPLAPGTVSGGTITGGVDGIWNISIPQPKTVWASDYDGTGSGINTEDWTKTTNGGLLWKGGTITDAAGLSASNIFGLDSNTAVYMFYNLTGTLIGAAYRTTDGGATWSQLNVFPSSTDFPDWGTFFDSNNGVMFGDPPNGDGIFRIYTTSDGGATWTQIPGANIEDPLIGETGLNGQSFCKANGTTVWAGSTSGRVIKSTDMGHTWRPYGITGLSGTAGVEIFGVAAVDSSTCVVLAATSTADLGAWETNDGGVTWTNVVTPDGSSGWIGSDRTGISYVPGTAGDSAVFVLTGGNPAAAATRGSVYTKDFVNYTTMDTFQHTAVLFESPTEGYSGYFQYNVPADTLLGDGMWVLEGSFTGVHSPVFDAGTMKLYPNPAKDYFTFNLQMHKPASLQVSLMNSLGDVVATYVNPQAYGIVEHNFNTQNLARGLYLLQVKVGNTQSTRKIIIQ